MRFDNSWFIATSEAGFGAPHAPTRALSKSNKCPNADPEQQRPKAGYHHGGGSLPFVLSGAFGGNRCVCAYRGEPFHLWKGVTHWTLCQSPCAKESSPFEIPAACVRTHAGKWKNSLCRGVLSRENVVYSVSSNKSLFV